jgi:hypothetical protein
MRNSTIGLRAVADQSVSVADFVPGLRESFLAPGADYVCIEYAGMLGGRVIGTPVLLTAKGKYVAFEVPQDAQQEFSALCVALLDTRFPDWSASEGAEGRFLWNLASNDLIQSHALRVISDEAVEGIAPLTCTPAELCASEIPF